MGKFRAPAPAPGKTWLRASAPGPWNNQEVFSRYVKQFLSPLKIQ